MFSIGQLHAETTGGLSALIIKIWDILDFISPNF